MKFKTNDWIFYNNKYYKIEQIFKNYYGIKNSDFLHWEYDPLIREGIKVTDQTKIVLLELQYN